MKQTSFPGVYRRGSRFVAVYRRGGRQCKQTAATFAEAREIKLTRDAEARAKRRGPTLHGHALGWLDRYAGSGRDSVREGTRREYRRLLSTFALRYFDHYVRLRDLDPPAFQQFVDWLTNMPGRGGRLSDRSIANALTPLRLALDAAVAEGMLDRNPADSVVLPRRRHGRAWELKERRFLSREQLARLLAEGRRSGDRCSSCSLPPGCGSRRRSGFAGATSCSTPRSRICGSPGRSSAVWR
jgi:Phage integrase SAM-like domain